MIYATELMIFLIFTVTCFSKGLNINEEVQICKQKLIKEQNLHKSDKARLKLHLKNTRHNIRVYQRMLKDRDLTIKKLKEENRELKNQRILSEPTKAPVLNLSVIKNESETCDGQTQNLLVFNEIARDGNNEEAVITRGLSSVIGQINSTYKMGDQDQLISSFNTNGEFKYTLNGACGVKFQDRIHFFGGWNHPEWNDDYNYENQHFAFDGNGAFVKYENLGHNFHTPQCTDINISISNVQSRVKEVVLICFDWNKQNACFTYDNDEVTEFVASNEYHFWARLGHYKNQIITVGCTRNSQSTEILDRSQAGLYK